MVLNFFIPKYASIFITFAFVFMLFNVTYVYNNYIIKKSRSGILFIQK